MKTGVISVLAAMLAASACGAAHAASNTPAPSGSIQLPKNLVYDGGGNLEVTIVADTYKAVKQNAKGTYYLGPPGCWSVTPTKKSWGMNFEVGKVWRTVDCGILVPAKKGKPKIFVVVGTSSAPPAQPDIAAQQALSQNISGGSMAGAAGSALGFGLVAALAELEKGNYSIPFGKAQPPGTMLQDAIGLR